MENNAAHNLTNVTLKSGWYVRGKIKRDDNHSGSNFSVGYLVEKDDQIAFMKAFDFAGYLAIAIPKEDEEEIDAVDVVNDMTTAFIYERDLSKHCRDKHVTKVAFVKESGQEYVSGPYSIPIVPYLIFELAEGDIRKVLDFSHDLNYAWRLKSLHDVAVGIMQLHKIEVSHQDLKPSNILVFERESKLGDLGRSISRDLDGPYNKRIFTGDRTYAPPEILYRYYENDWQKRVFATDCYMLGSLIVFHFSGISMSVLMAKYTPDNFSWHKWRGEFQDLVPYLENAYAKALEEFKSNINNETLKHELTELVSYLCNPFPEKRGHPRNVLFGQNKYNMERFVTILDVLKRKAEIKIKTF